MCIAFNKNAMYPLDMDTKTPSSGPSGRVVRVVEMSPEASVALDQFVHQTGLNKKLVVSKVLEWFSILGRETQVAIMFQPDNVMIRGVLNPTESKGNTDDPTRH